MKKSMTTLLMVFLFLGFSTPASATLWDRGGGLIYDDHLKITWLQDANYAYTSGYSTANGGLMNWYAADAWADQLVFGGYDNWRLPTTVNELWVWGHDGTTSAGYNITTSELGYMYYTNLENKGYYATDGTYQPDWGLKNTGPFLNLQSYVYWSGTEYLDQANAWIFTFDTAHLYPVREGGFQDVGGPKDCPIGFYSWAVHDGDIGAPVPEPATMLLLASGLAGIAGFRRKFRKS